MARKATASPGPHATGPEDGRRVLVVGCGYLGRNMALGLAPRRQITVLARRPVPHEVKRVARVVRGDAGDSAVLAEAMAGVEHVVWCAGGLLPADAERDPAGDARATLGPLEVLLGLVDGADGPTVTYLSSGGTVYGDPDLVPVPEDAPTRPIGEYGRVRLRAERLLLDARAERGLRVRVLRCANVYGGDQPADRGQGAVAVFLDRVLRGAEIVLYDGGRAVRDFVHVDDVVGAAGDLLGHGGPAVLNVGSGRGAAIVDVLSMVERHLGARAVVVHRPRRPFDVRQIVLDVGRLQATVPYRPRDLEDGIRALSAARERERTPR